MAARRKVPRTQTVQGTVPEPAEVAKPIREKSRVPRDDEAQLAPYPVADMQPKIMGSDITLDYIGQMFRWGHEGHRRDYVDMLNELLERDPFAYGVAFSRILGALSGKLVIEPPEDLPESKKARALLLCQFVKTRLARIKKFKNSLSQLLWANYYGITCQETTWGIEQQTNFRVPMRMHLVHSRRVEYPFFDSWDAYIVDNSMSVVGDSAFGRDKRQRADSVRRYGIRIDDFHGKFVLHVANLRGDYPTREGYGRQIAFWLCIKAMAARSGALLIERFAIPFAIAYLNTVVDEKAPRVASNTDAALAQAVLTALATGKTSKALLPDSIKIEFEQAIQSAGKMPVLEFLRYVDAQIAKAIIGSSELSDDDTSGNKGRAEVVQSFILSLLQYDADMLCETLQETLVDPLIEYNFPEDLDITPRICLKIEQPPNMEALKFYAEVAEIAQTLGAQVDLRAFADKVLLKLAEGSPDISLGYEEKAKMDKPPAPAVPGKPSAGGSKTKKPAAKKKLT